MGISLVVQWVRAPTEGGPLLDPSLVGALRSCKPLSTTPHPKKIGTDTSEKKYTNDRYVREEDAHHQSSGKWHVTMCSGRAHSHHSARTGINLLSKTQEGNKNVVPPCIYNIWSTRHFHICDLVAQWIRTVRA